MPHIPVPQNIGNPAASDTSESTLCSAAALFLMSHYAQQPCPLVAHAIADQLGILSRHCAEGTTRALQSLALALLPRWQQIASGQSMTTARH